MNNTVRKNFLITELQADMLEMHKKKTGIGHSELVRNLLDMFFNEQLQEEYYFSCKCGKRFKIKTD